MYARLYFCIILDFDFSQKFRVLFSVIFLRFLSSTSYKIHLLKIFLMDVFYTELLLTAVIKSKY